MPSFYPSKKYPDVPAYQSARWRHMRAAHLRDNPCCVYCAPAIVAGYAVDHVVPHRGDPALFFDPDNLQTLCKDHHNVTKYREEIRGASCAANAAGQFIDARHPWNCFDSTPDGDAPEGGAKSEIA